MYRYLKNFFKKNFKLFFFTVYTVEGALANINFPEMVEHLSKVKKSAKISAAKWLIFKGRNRSRNLNRNHLGKMERFHRTDIDTPDSP
jgi:hypothetical protein